MILRCLILVLSTLNICVQAASSTATSTRFYGNTTSATSTSTLTSTTSSVTGACCFVVQDTVSEEWWQLHYSTGPGEINLTSITTYVTPYSNGTSTNIVTNIYSTSGTFVWPSTGGVNPITNYLNGAPDPTEVSNELNGTATVTGGVTVISPQAFYVYNSVKILTVAAVTDGSGNVACGIPSTRPGVVDDDGATIVPALTFADINSNAQAYFGGYGIGGPSLLPTETFTRTYEIVHTSDILSTQTSTYESIGFSTLYLNTEGSALATDQILPTGVVLSLATPFIYQPERGKSEVWKADRCTQGPGKENYGYVPQELIDFLGKDPAYSSQFPGLASCLPGGPSILKGICYTALETIQTAVGGDLTSSTVITVNPKGGVIVTPTPPPKGPVSNVVGGQTQQGVVSIEVMAQTGAEQNPPVSVAQNPPVSVAQGPPIQTNQAPPASAPQGPPAPGNQGPPASAPQNPPASIPQAPPNQGGPTPIAQPPPKPSLGAIINSIIGGAPNSPTVQGVVIAGPTTIPVAGAPAGLAGSTAIIQGTPVIIVPAATTLPAEQGVVIPGPTTIAVAGAPAGLGGSTTVIGGTPVIIVPAATTLPAEQGVVVTGPTTIPVAGAPAGVVGSTTIIGGTPFIIVPAATTIPAGQGIVIPGPTTIPVALVGSTTIIGGTPFIIIPGATTIGPAAAQGVVIGPTTIPVAGAPAGLTGSTTVIGGTPFIIVPAATILPIAAEGAAGIAGASTTIIGGTPFVIIPGPTSIPVAGAPSALTGSTTTIDGTPFIIVPATTTVPVAPSEATGIAGASTTIIGGTPFVIIPGPTTIPLAGAPTGLTGSTTTINGTPFLIVPSSTTVPLSNGGVGVSTTVFGGISFLIYPSPTTIPLSGAPAGLTGSTTTISGTPYLILSGGTTIPFSSPRSTPAPTPVKTYPGQITVISGTQYEIFSGPTTVPVDPDVPLKGKTTVISGTTEVILTGPTTVPVKGTGSANGGANNKSSAMAGRRIAWMEFLGLVGSAFVLVFW